MPADELSPAARELIRSYMLSYALPSGAALTVIGAVLGFVLSRSTESLVTAQAITRVSEAANAVGAATGRASVLEQEFTRAVVAARASKDEIEKTRAATDAALQASSKNLSDNYSKIAEALTANKDFKASLATVSQEEIGNLKDRIANVAQFELSILKSEYRTQDVAFSCPAGTKIVSASCIGNNGSPQAAVGPDIRSDGSFTCYRYGPTVMPVQATAICLKQK